MTDEKKKRGALTVDEAIAQLKEMPGTLLLRTWSESEDEDVDVTGFLYEDGVSYVQVLTDGDPLDDLIQAEEGD